MKQLSQNVEVALAYWLWDFFSGFPQLYFAFLERVAGLHVKFNLRNVFVNVFQPVLVKN